jgi:hypothetical protein
MVIKLNMDAGKKSYNSQLFKALEAAINAFCRKALSLAVVGGITQAKDDLGFGRDSQFRKLVTADKNDDADLKKQAIVSAYNNCFVFKKSKCPETMLNFANSELYLIQKIEDAFAEYAGAFGASIGTETWWKPANVHTSGEIAAEGLLPSPAPPSTWELAGTFLCRDLPAASKVTLSDNAKEKLYGGDPHLSLSQLELVSLGHNFDRESVASLLEAILGSDKKCSMITLRATHGNGLSLALAQLAKEACLVDGALTLSIIGEPEKTTSFLELLKRSEAKQMAEWAKGLPRNASHLVIIIDDVSETTPKGLSGLYSYISECEQLFLPETMPKLTFVLGWFGSAGPLSMEIIDLNLTDSDIESCYQKMAIGEPPIIAPNANGHAGILRNANSVRALGNDAQALIDFLLEHGQATQPLKKHWLAEIDQERPGQIDPLTLTAAAQSLDLAIPEQIAIRLFAARDERRTSGIKGILAKNRRLTGTRSIDPGIGPGMGLSCPRRANSILSRLKRAKSNKPKDWFDTDCIERDFCVLISAALASYEASEPDAEISLNFARHIFQRLGKKEFLALVGDREKALIVERLAITFQTWIFRLSENWLASTKIEWAATMSALLKNSRYVDTADRVWQREWARFVTQMCTDFLQALHDERMEQTPASALRLLKAVRRLNIAAYFVGDSITLMNQVRGMITAEALTNLINDQLEHVTDDSIYRANELLHQWCRFEEAFDSASRSKARSNEISATLDQLKCLFQSKVVLLDPGSLIEFSRYVWVDDSDTDAWEAATGKKLEFLELAEIAIVNNPQKLASWDKQLQEEKAKILMLIDEYYKKCEVSAHG